MAKRDRQRKHRQRMPGDCDYPARRAVTMTVLGGLDFIETALHWGERRSVDDPFR